MRCGDSGGKKEKGESAGACVLGTLSCGAVRRTPALLPMSSIPRNNPAILPSQPRCPNTRNAAATSPAILNPDTLPRPRLLKNPPSMSVRPPPEVACMKFDTPFNCEPEPLTALPIAETVSPAFSFSSRASSTVLARTFVAGLPTTASLTIRATLASVVSFFQPT